MIPSSEYLKFKSRFLEESLTKKELKSAKKFFPQNYKDRQQYSSFEQHAIGDRKLQDLLKEKGVQINWKKREVLNEICHFEYDLLLQMYPSLKQNTASAPRIQNSSNNNPSQHFSSRVSVNTNQYRNQNRLTQCQKPACQDSSPRQSSEIKEYSFDESNWYDSDSYGVDEPVSCYSDSDSDDASSHAAYLSRHQNQDIYDLNQYKQDSSPGQSSGMAQYSSNEDAPIRVALTHDYNIQNSYQMGDYQRPREPIASEDTYISSELNNQDFGEPKRYVIYRRGYFSWLKDIYNSENVFLRVGFGVGVGIAVASILLYKYLGSYRSSIKPSSVKPSPAITHIMKPCNTASYMNFCDDFREFISGCIDYVWVE